MSAPEHIDRTTASSDEFLARFEPLVAADVCELDAIERVARAISDVDHAPEHGSSPPWDELFDEFREHYRRLARAAVAALKGTDTAGQPSCGDLSPAIGLSGAGRFMCELPHGHEGAHQHSNGPELSPMRWITADTAGQRWTQDDLRDAWQAGRRAGLVEAADTAGQYDPGCPKGLGDDPTLCMCESASDTAGQQVQRVLDELGSLQEAHDRANALIRKLNREALTAEAAVARVLAVVDRIGTLAEFEREMGRDDSVLWQVRDHLTAAVAGSRPDDSEAGR